MFKLIDYVKKRLTEKSTWLGFGAAGAGTLTTAGQYLTPDQLHLVAIGVAVSGVAAVLAPTGGDPDA